MRVKINSFIFLISSFTWIGLSNSAYAFPPLNFSIAKHEGSGIFDSTKFYIVSETEPDHSIYRNQASHVKDLVKQVELGLSTKDLEKLEDIIQENSVLESPVLDPAYSNKKNFSGSGFHFRRDGKQYVIETYEGVVYTKGSTIESATARLFELERVAKQIINEFPDRELDNPYMKAPNYEFLSKKVARITPEGRTRDLLRRMVATKLLAREFKKSSLIYSSLEPALGLLRETQDPVLKENAKRTFSKFKIAWDDPEFFELIDFEKLRKDAAIYDQKRAEFLASRASNKNCVVPATAPASAIQTTTSSSANIVEQLLNRQKELETQIKSQDIQIKSKDSEIAELKRQIASLQACLDPSQVSELKEPPLATVVTPGAPSESKTSGSGR